MTKYKFIAMSESTTANKSANSDMLKQIAKLLEEVKTNEKTNGQEIKISLVQLSIDQKAILAKLDELSKLSPASLSIAPKRQIKTSAEPTSDEQGTVVKPEKEKAKSRKKIDTESSTTSSSTKASNAKSTTDTSVVTAAKTSTTKKSKASTEEKITTNSAFFKFMVLKRNYMDMRNNYSTQISTVVNDSNNSKKLKKKEEGTDEYWLTIAPLVWKVLTKPEQTEITKLFKAWDEKNKKQKDNDQLNEDEENKDHEEEEEEKENEEDEEND